MSRHAGGGGHGRPGPQPQAARGADRLRPRRRAGRDVRPPPGQLPPPLQVRLQGLVRPRHRPAPPPAVRADPGGVPLRRRRRRRVRELPAHVPARHDAAVRQRLRDGGAAPGRLLRLPAAAAAASRLHRGVPRRDPGRPRRAGAPRLRPGARGPRPPPAGVLLRLQPGHGAVGDGPGLRLGPQRHAADGAHLPPLRRLRSARVPPAPVPARRLGLGAGGAHLLVGGRFLDRQGGGVAGRRVAGLGPRHGADPAGHGRRRGARRAAPCRRHRRHLRPQQPGGRRLRGPHAESRPAAAPRRGGEGLALGVRCPRFPEPAPLRHVRAPAARAAVGGGAAEAAGVGAGGLRRRGVGGEARRRVPGAVREREVRVPVPRRV